jgi:hypothetical protein
MLLKGGFTRWNTRKQSVFACCKFKQIYFFSLGARITDALVLCVLYFPEMRHTEELWVYMGTVSGGKDGRRYFAVFIVVSRSTLVSETKSDNSSCDVFKIL